MRKLSLVLALAATTLATLPRTALAAEDQAEASPTGKGITGGALLGGEAVMLTEAALKVKPWWAYALGGVAGGIAGGVGGFFIEDSADTKVSMYLLTGGMALVIPTTVAVLSASAYEPPANYTEDTGPSAEPAAEPPSATPAPAAGAKATPRKKPSKKLARHYSAPATLHYGAAPPALVGMGQGSLTLSLPAVEIRDMYSKKDLFQYGVSQKTEVRVPVFNFVF
ncbi:MAG: hypothetical protein KC776_11735 [Myxococcales bacterium]|nr:hypothetical protein [Myxococcales bacterium]MCB9582997.1 hypothetical protein [Polyangiaceae bacterium]